MKTEFLNDKIKEIQSMGMIGLLEIQEMVSISFLERKDTNILYDAIEARKSIISADIEAIGSEIRYDEIGCK